METKKIDVPKLQLSKQTVKALTTGQATNADAHTVTFPFCCRTA